MIRSNLSSFGEGRFENEIAPCSLKPLHPRSLVRVVDRAMCRPPPEVGLDGAQAVRPLAVPELPNSDQLPPAVKPIACCQSPRSAAGSRWQWALKVRRFANVLRFCSCVSFRWRRFACAHGRVSVSSIFARNGEGNGQQAAFVIGRRVAILGP